MTASVRSGATRRAGKAAPGAEAKNTGEVAKGRGKNTIRKKPPIKISSQEWKEMVAAAAYYRAEARGFYGGSPEQDWLDAEAELLERLAPDAGRPATAQQKPRSKKSGKITR
jgi:hypothetical protein